MEFLNLRLFLNEISKTRSKLVLLRTDLDKPQVRHTKCGATEFNNRISISLRHEIKEHETLLRRSEQKLARMAN